MKKSLIVLFTLIFVMAFSGIVSAAETEKIQLKLKDDVKVTDQKVDLSKYEIIKPTKEVISMSSKSFVASGKAIPGSDIVIAVYSAPDLRKKDYNLEKLPTAEEYILLGEETIKASKLGLFQKSIDLVSGVNKIVIKFGDENIKPVELIVYVYENLELNKPNDGGDILPLLR